MVESFKFQLGNRNFGTTELILINITDELSELDGFLGTNFIYHHVLYLDKEEGWAYIK